MIESLLLDLDGTLIDSRADLTDAVNHALKRAGFSPQSQESIIPHVGNGLRDLLSEVLGPVTDETLAVAIDAFTDFYSEHCVDQTVLYENVKSCLLELHGHLKIGVVTNKPHFFAYKIIHDLGVGDYISTIIGGDSLPHKKPHPAPVLRAAFDLGLPTSTALVVGDGPQDILSGQSAGSLTCIARYGYGFNPDTLELKPDYEINAFNEIKEIVL